MRFWRSHAPGLLLVGGAVLLIAAGLLAATHLAHHRAAARAQPVTQPTTQAATTAEQTTAEQTTAVSTTTAQTTTAAPVTPAPVAMSWDDAGGIVWHESAIDPIWLGQQMRAAGFGWVALYLGEDDDASPPDPSWIARFRAASGLAVGGWSVLGVDPAQDAAQAVQLIREDGLAFYIADAEAPYGYTEGDSTSATRFGRSRAFVSAFRAAEPSLPAAVSSYCRPDQHDLDWHAWANGGFAFLPQAYVNELGAAVSPATCVRAAAAYFPRSQVHPTVASYAGQRGIVRPDSFARLLARAGTTGFSIYPAEAGLSMQDWQAYGRAITSLHVANALR